jgi:NADH-quinone oxidoreductase subunit J
MIGGLIWMFFAALAIGSCLVIATSKNILHCAFALLFALISVCAFYIFLGADFLAITQVVVYVGGILVLVLFGVMMTHRLQARTLREEIVQPVASFAAAAVILVLTLLVIRRQAWPVSDLPEAVPTTREIGRAFLTSHLFPFEFASLLLLVAMMGAALLSREKKED